MQISKQTNKQTNKTKQTSEQANEQVNKLRYKHAAQFQSPGQPPVGPGPEKTSTAGRGDGT